MTRLNNHTVICGSEQSAWSASSVPAEVPPIEPLIRKVRVVDSAVINRDLSRNYTPMSPPMTGYMAATHVAP